MPHFRNVNPLGAVELPLIGGRVVEAGEVFEVTAEQAKQLDEQPGNYERVKQPRSPKNAAPAPSAADVTTTEKG